MYHAKPSKKKGRTCKHTVALSMEPYGIRTVVFTDLQALKSLRASYCEAFQNSASNREQFLKYREDLKASLLTEDAYFDVAAHEISSGTKRWQSFCDDCVAYAAISAALDTSPLCFVHPKLLTQLGPLPMARLGKRHLTPVPDVPFFNTLDDARTAGFNI